LSFTTATFCHLWTQRYHPPEPLRPPLSTLQAQQKEIGARCKSFHMHRHGHVFCRSTVRHHKELQAKHTGGSEPSRPGISAQQPVVSASNSTPCNERATTSSGSEILVLAGERHPEISQNEHGSPIRRSSLGPEKQSASITMYHDRRPVSVALGRLGRTGLRGK